MDLKSTLLLPDADATIPMKANLPQLEPSIQAIWNEKHLYNHIQSKRHDAPTFVLHDGPPYTNSGIHLGTALNKILKDFVVKSRTMMGYRAPYVPGFDNHGLPIEQAVQKKFAEKKQTPTVVELVKACREHAQGYIQVQTDQFKRLGVHGQWELPYRTMAYKYEAELVRTFKRLVEGGFIYKGLRPTLWSPTSQTALADTEIVYHDDHVSKAIYVRFPLGTDPNQLFHGIENVYTIIWTTTPWTIPANLACAFHPDFEYSLVKVGEDHYLIGSALVEKVAAALGWEGHKVVKEMLGINFEHMTFHHPIFGRPSIAVMADYVTTEDGTGVVHTAPSHGRDDFFTGQKYGLPVPNTVNPKGVLTEEAGEFEGVYFKDCDKVVVERLQEVGALLDVRDYVHSYPYAERDDKPVIFRATEQWFISLEHNDLRANMLHSIENVQWLPAQGQNRIEAMIRNRPDWCISRQRPWGVGIPVIYGLDSGKPVLDPEIIEAVAQLVEQHGSEAWWSTPVEDIIPHGYTHPETGETTFRKETDVLDVWFDSGSSSLCVLEGNVEPSWKENWPADLYLEGSDQHRGWFNTSLILGHACNGQAPYKTVVTHGFVTDEQGRKMSKRLGNVIDPVAASDQYGADILRYWVASVDYANDVPCSDAILKQFGEHYRNVRNALRFLLGNLKGYKRSMAPAELLPLDEWIVEQVDLLVNDSISAYQSYDFGKVIGDVYAFTRQQLSNFYMDVIKDRMYCDAEDSEARRSGQAASLYVVESLLKLLAPILVHTAEETWMKLHEVLGEEADSIHVAEFNAPSEERMEEIEGSALQVRFARLLEVRAVLNTAFEAYKATGEVKNSQNAIAQIAAEGDFLDTLREFSTEELSTLLKVSWVELTQGELNVTFRPSSYEECERSRLRRPDVQEYTLGEETIKLTARDYEVVRKLVNA